MFILPSRGRPAELNRFVLAYFRTYAQASVFVYLDEDDPKLSEYQYINTPPNWKLKIGPRIKIGPVFNQVFQEFPQESYYALIGDDAVPLTDEWDRILIEAAGVDKLSYPDDLWRSETLATHPVIGGDLVRKAGFIAYGELKQYFIDTWWFHIAKFLGRLVYCPRVKLDHLHHQIGKAPVDSTYEGKWPDADSDRKIFDAFIADSGTPNYIRRVFDDI